MAVVQLVSKKEYTVAQFTKMIEKEYGQPRKIIERDGWKLHHITMRLKPDWYCVGIDDGYPPLIDIEPICVCTYELADDIIYIHLSDCHHKASEAKEVGRRINVDVTYYEDVNKALLEKIIECK